MKNIKTISIKCKKITYSITKVNMSHYVELQDGLYIPSVIFRENAKIVK